MRRELVHHSWIVAAAAAVFFANLGGAGLFDEDEPKNATCAREMFERGDWVEPSFNGELRTDKPVLYYWLTMAAYSVFGVSEFSARFASAALAVGTVLGTYHIGRLLFRPEAGLWAALAMTSALMYDVVARAATPDSTLIFCTTMALWAYVYSVSRRGANVWQAGEQLPHDGGATAGASSSRQNRARELALFAPHSWRGAAMIYAAMGLAVLAKGPVGVVLPLAAIGLFLLVITTPWLEAVDASPEWHERLLLWLRRAIRPFHPVRVMLVGWALRPLTAVATLALVVLPWYLAVGVRTRGAWLSGFLGHHNVGRFLEPLENHSGPFFYYVIAIMIGFFPWSIFFTLTGLHVARRLRARHPWRAGYLLLLCWLGMYVVFFSLARTKLPNYVLPAYPALALLVGAFIDEWATAPAAVSRRLVRLALATLALVGVGLFIGLPIAAYILLPGEWALGLVGLAPLVGACVAFHWLHRDQSQRAAVAVAVACTLFACGAFGWAAPRVARHQNSPSLASLAHEHHGGDARIAAFDCFTPSLVFYAGGQVRALHGPDEVAEHFRSSDSAVLVARDENLAALADLLPADVHVLAREPRFLRRGELVLLGRSRTAATEVARKTQTFTSEKQR